MSHDPFFWVLAVIAVLIAGISKGGFGGISLLSVPLMATVISPVQATAILLPIIMVMDLISVRSYWGVWDKKVFLLTAPGALCGIALGTALAGYVDDQWVRICVGALAIIFPLNAFFKRANTASFARGNRPLGFVAGVGSGFASFIAHAGAPPYHAYLIPQGLDKRVFAGTSVMMFFMMNLVKVVPFAMLGQLDRENLTTSLYLIPLAPVGVLSGVWLVKRINQTRFFQIMYAIIFLVGLKLLWDGLVR